MTLAEYDLVVIGSGPAGQKGAIAAAKARKRVAVIAGVQSIAVEHRVTQGFAKGQFDELLVSQNTATTCNIGAT